MDLVRICPYFSPNCSDGMDTGVGGICDGSDGRVGRPDFRCCCFFPDGEGSETMFCPTTVVTTGARTV